MPIISQKNANSVLFSYATEEDSESSWGVSSCSSAGISCGSLIGLYINDLP